MSSPVIELAKTLIRCPSITPQDGNCQNILSHHLEAIGFHCEAMPFGEVSNLWAKYGNNGPLLVFAGHTDVVPPGPDADWQSPPFDPVIRDGYLYGRGACDMKSAIAAMVIATENFLQKNTSFKGSIAFLLTSDEEGPSIDGTQKVIEVLQKRGEKIDYCIIGEPSSKEKVGDQIRVGRRGSLHGKLTVHGKQGHVAHPHLAINPIHSSMQALHKLASAIWDEGNAEFPPTTFQISNIHSGTGAANVIPGHLECLINFRFSSAITPQQLQEQTEKVLHDHGIKYDLEWNIGAKLFLTQQGKLIQATQQAIKEITHQETKLSTGGGTSDGRFIAPTGAELVELGVSHETAHHTNEHVKIDDLETLTKIYLRLLEIVFL